MSGVKQVNIDYWERQVSNEEQVRIRSLLTITDLTEDEREDIIESCIEEMRHEEERAKHTSYYMPPF